jgi:Tfp pilus assembly protein PilF
VKLDPADATAWDGMARIWRSWGFPRLGLGAAHRAAFFAPDSASAQNSLGMTLYALGWPQQARAHFERAVLLDSRASYALNNLCYSLLLDGRGLQAAEACQRALALQPGLVSARNNLALAILAGGDLLGAARQFSESGDAAAADYNMGIVYLAARRFGDATRAFESAARRRPSFVMATKRAREARTLALQAGEAGGLDDRD